MNTTEDTEQWSKLEDVEGSAKKIKYLEKANIPRSFRSKFGNS